MKKPILQHLIRLNKWLAAQGVASRRTIDLWITQGKIKIDGKVVSDLGVKIDPTNQRILVNDRLVRADEPIKKVYYAFYKPKNVVTTLKDTHQRPTVGDYIKNMGTRLFPVGRLDYDAEGLLILTNDGAWANQLMHPRYGHQRIYRVKIKGRPSDMSIKALKTGFNLEDGFCCFTSVKFLKTTQNNSWFDVSIGVGKYHIVKRLFEASGHPVLKLIRTHIGSISLDELQPGQMRRLSKTEINSCQ